MKEFAPEKLNIFYDADDPPSGGDPKEPPKEPTKEPSKDDLQPIPYDRFKEVLDDKKKLEARIADIEKKQKDALETTLKEQNKWEELYKQKEKEAEEQKARNLRLQIAAKKGIPVDLVDRLRGNTEEEISADADSLLDFIKSPEGPGMPKHKKGGEPKILDIESMTPAEIREHSNEILKQEANK